MLMREIARNGIKPVVCMRIWADMKRHGMTEPEAWGWPGATIEHRLRTQGHGAKEPGQARTLTAPESAVDALCSEQAISLWVDGIIRDCGPRMGHVVRLRWLMGMDFAKISERTGWAVEDVKRDYRAAMRRVDRGLAFMSTLAYK